MQKQEGTGHVAKLYLFIFTRLAPAMATVGSDTQQEVGGNRSDGDHKAHKGNEKIVVQCQGQVAGLEALLRQREQRGSLHFRWLPALG